MKAARRCAAAGFVVAHVLIGAGGALSASAPSRPSSSAPSEYVEVVPTGGGGSSNGSRAQQPSPATGTANASSGPGSVLGAAADAIGSAERHVIGLGATMLVVTLWLAQATATRRRQATSRRGHVPKG
jgi:hypothetical protein